MKVCIVGAKLFHADGQKDRPDDAISRSSQFCEYAWKCTGKGNWKVIVWHYITSCHRVYFAQFYDYNLYNVLNETVTQREAFSSKRLETNTYVAVLKHHCITGCTGQGGNLDTSVGFFGDW
jgi:hypothetical protein